MIVVKVELWSAITGAKTELARMHISNDGTVMDPNKGNYDVATLRGRSSADLDRGVVHRRARVADWPRKRLHVWNLVQAALTLAGYGHVKTVDPNREPVPYDGGYE